MTITMDAHAWAEAQFSQCDLKDERRTRRLVEVAASAVSHPAGSLPEQSADMADLKAAYRLFACEDVSFEAIVGPHWERTRRRLPGTYLVLDDTTELDFGIRREIQGMGRTGNGGGWGFLLHSALVVSAKGEEIFGLAGEKIRYRKPTPKKENTTQRLKRDRESVLWGQVIDQVGQAPEGVRWVHVMDRGADNFEVYCHCREQHVDWVVRVTQKQRHVIVPEGTKHKSPYLKRLTPMPIAMWVVHAVEVDAPKDVERVEWLLLTSLPVTSFDEAWQILEYYEKRWLIEEYHKALKTGCRVECRQLKSKEGLERITALLSVVAVRLLQLKSTARTNPVRQARHVVPLRWIQMLLAARKRSKHTEAMTIGEFYRELAKLGGFLGRKSDGEPGWITIWRGWQKLYLLVRGAKLAQNLK